MGNQFSPGPWLRIDKEDYAEIQSAFSPSAPAIALVRRWEDANLIAAAPDMFNALRKLLFNCYGAPDHATACERTMGATHPCTCGADAARAILARVEGADHG